MINKKITQVNWRRYGCRLRVYTGHGESVFDELKKQTPKMDLPSLSMMM
jgi:hypothetical protein